MFMFQGAKIIIEVRISLVSNIRIQRLYYWNLGERNTAAVELFKSRISIT